MSQAEALAIVTQRLQQQRAWKKGRVLPETLIKLWSAQLISALSALHSEGIIVR